MQVSVAFSQPGPMLVDLLTDEYESDFSQSNTTAGEPPEHTVAYEPCLIAYLMPKKSPTICT
jgi:hypothetical protein